MPIVALTLPIGAAAMIIPIFPEMLLTHIAPLFFEAVPVVTFLEAMAASMSPGVAEIATPVTVAVSPIATETTAAPVAAPAMGACRSFRSREVSRLRKHRRSYK